MARCVSCRCTLNWCECESCHGHGKVIRYEASTFFSNAQTRVEEKCESCGEWGGRMTCPKGCEQGRMSA